MNVIDLIDAQLLHIAAPETPAVELAAWVQPIKEACVKFEIDRVRRVAAFIAQMAHESGLKPRNENLNYSVDGLLKTFGRHRISEADARAFGRTATQKANQEAIANRIYGGEYGRKNLGNTGAFDGWTFRGTGPLQITGRANFMGFANSMNMPTDRMDEVLAYARTLEGGIMAAAWFWEENDINRLADTPGVEDESRRINGGTNGLADRRARFDRVVAELLKRGA
jgi:putative chitinase